MLIKNIAGALLAVGMLFPAHASFIEQSSQIDYEDTDFSGFAMTFDQFDDLNGTRLLESIEFVLFGEVVSTARVENFSSNSGSNISVLVNALLELTSATGESLVTSLPSLTRNFQATPFDGVADFAGTSGNTFEDLYANNMNDNLITDQAILSLFTGTGTIDTYLGGIADTRASGGGNVLSGFVTQARGAVDVVYNYRTVQVTGIHEPSLFALMLIGMLGAIRLKRQK